MAAGPHRQVDAERDAVGKGEFDLRLRSRRSQDPDVRQHPPPRADHHHRLFGRVEPVLVEVPHRRECLAGTEKRLDVRVGQVDVAGRDTDHQLRCGSVTAPCWITILRTICSTRLRSMVARVVISHYPFDPFRTGCRDPSRTPCAAITTPTPATSSCSRQCWLRQSSTTMWPTADRSHKMGQRLVTELRAVGQDNHFVGHSHHRPFRFDQQQVAVKTPPWTDRRNAQEGLADVQAVEHLVGIRPDHHAGAAVDVTADQDQVRA